jgi:hypothetical protein
MRVAIVVLGMTALTALGVSFTQAAPPFTTTVAVTELSDLTVTITGNADSPSKADHHIVIDWGDGNEDVLPNFTSDAPWAWGPVGHTYAASGDYVIVATLIHATPQGNDRGSASINVTVVAPSVEDDTDDTQVKGNKITKKKPGRLATTGPETVGLAAAGSTLLLSGVALRLVATRRENDGKLAA